MGALMAELEELVGKFRSAEAEVAARFFAKNRSLKEHLSWLRFQVTREARNLEEIASHQRCKLAEEVDYSASREDFVDQLMEDYQEARHYAMLAYLYEGVGGEKIKWKELREEAKNAPWYELSRREHGRWSELKQTGSKLQLAAALFTRGGGGALFYGFIPLRGGDYETLLSEASKIILRDELEHGASEGRDLLYGELRSPADVEIARETIMEMSLIRLRMRNEQFSGVFSERRLEEIAKGAIKSLTLDEMLRACSTSTADWFKLYQEKTKPLSSASIVG
jgi:hypothetical protein